jgi:hypothetical protein
MVLLMLSLSSSNGHTCSVESDFKPSIRLTPKPKLLSAELESASAALLWSLVVDVVPLLLLLLLVVPTGLSVLSSLLLLLLVSLSRREGCSSRAALLMLPASSCTSFAAPVTAAMVSGTLDCSS